MENNQMQITQRIIFLMKKLSVNQKQFAQLLGVTQPAVSKYLKVRIPPALILLKLATISSTSIEWILTGKEEYVKTGVAEPVSSYGQSLKIDRQLSILPVSIQKRIGELINEMISVLQDSKNIRV